MAYSVEPKVWLLKKFLVLFCVYVCVLVFIKGKKFLFDSVHLFDARQRGTTTTTWISQEDSVFMVNHVFIFRTQNHSPPFSAFFSLLLLLILLYMLVWLCAMLIFLIFCFCLFCVIYSDSRCLCQGYCTWHMAHGKSHCICIVVMNIYQDDKIVIIRFVFGIWHPV